MRVTSLASMRTFLVFLAIAVAGCASSRPTEPYELVLGPERGGFGARLAEGRVFVAIAGVAGKTYSIVLENKGSDPIFVQLAPIFRTSDGLRIVPSAPGTAFNLAPGETRGLNGRLHVDGAASVEAEVTVRAMGVRE